MLHRAVAAIFAVLVVVPCCLAEEATEPRAYRAFDRPTPDADLVGDEAVVRVHAQDTLAEVAKREALGFEELRLANPKVDPWLPADGTQVILPTRFVLPQAARKGIVINTAEMRLYYFAGADGNGVEKVITFPVSVGGEKSPTPVVSTRVISKILDPVWYPPASLRSAAAAEGRQLPMSVPPGPDNPLGRYALNLEIPGIFIHSTNHPYGIGMRVTHGCIRLFPSDMEWLIRNVVSNETQVAIVRQPFKVGWHEGVLFLEVHPSGADGKEGLDEMERVVTAALTARPEGWVNWDYARELAQDPDGMPHAIGGGSPVEGQLTRR